MESHVRAAVAYVAGRLILGVPKTSIYDYSKSGHISIGGEVSSGRVKVRDYTNDFQFGGSGNGSSYALYHYGESCHVSLRIEGQAFKGFDYGTSSQFSGRVRGKLVSLYDYGAGADYSYSL
jgi:hypothetical protein